MLRKYDEYEFDKLGINQNGTDFNEEGYNRKGEFL